MGRMEASQRFFTQCDNSFGRGKTMAERTRPAPLMHGGLLGRAAASTLCMAGTRNGSPAEQRNAGFGQ
jgi:hypothetical protein